MIRRTRSLLRERLTHAHPCDFFCPGLRFKGQGSRLRTQCASTHNIHPTIQQPLKHPLLISPTRDPHPLAQLDPYKVARIAIAHFDAPALEPAGNECVSLGEAGLVFGEKGGEEVSGGEDVRPDDVCWA
jgi:hypothetical protein